MMMEIQNGGIEEMVGNSSIIRLSIVAKPGI